jgi:hypothetical protein
MKQTIFALMALKCGIRRAAWSAPLLATVLVFTSHISAQEGVAEKMEQLDSAILRVQTQVDESQRQLRELQQQLAALRQQAGLPAKNITAASASADATQLAAAVEEVREKQDVQEAALAAHEQAKVESASKYPVTLSGMILFNGFVNTRAVDTAPTPTVALAGSGATGASLRQSLIGIDARGPHVFGARSHADLRGDFDGAAASSAGELGFLRLRTAHAELDWKHTTAFFSLDRPLISPETPTSLTAIAEPALAWSGNLWAWNPQAGVSEDLPMHRDTILQMQTALIDVADPPNAYTAAIPSLVTPPSASEQSRWPGVQARVALVSPLGDGQAHLGIGGYFAPHQTAEGTNFDSWAGTMDFRLPISSYFEFAGSAYRGAALGGLGGGAYKDYAYGLYAGMGYFRVLDDMGGWMQAKEKVNGRLEFNEALGIDNVPGNQLRPFATANPSSYYNLVRNRTFTWNVIYKPSAYLLYSIEYRRIASSPVNGPTEFSDVIGVAAGYKF